MTFRRSLTNKILPFAIALIGVGVFGCAGLNLEKKVKEISSQTMTLPQSYPAQVNRLFSEIGNVYGNEFVRELKQLPDMKEAYTPEKISALQDIYSVGKEIRDTNLTNAKTAIEDIVEAGADTPTTALISVPLREWYLMHANKKWKPEDAVKALNSYGKNKWGKNLSDNSEVINRYTSAMLNFVLKTDWGNTNNKDWRVWKKIGNESVVLYKKNLDILIQDNQSSRITPVPDRIGYVQSPKETRERGAGDCKDFAIEAAYDMEVLEEAGRYKDVEITSFWDYVKRKGHSFLTYGKKREEGISVLDNAAYITNGIRKFDSTIKAIKKIAEEHGHNPQRMWKCDRKAYRRTYPHFPDYMDIRE